MTVRWQRPARSKASRLYVRLVLATVAIGAGFLALSTHTVRPVLIYNPSPSAPLGYYRALASTSIRLGDWVLVDAPDAARTLADARGYLPSTVPMIKAIAGLVGDRICAEGNTISINGHAVAVRLAVDHNGRTLPWWQGCMTLGDDDVFLLNVRAVNSFDGRYFGPVKRSAIRARLVPL
jgi:conjugative transfer signal peptidase TraF